MSANIASDRGPGDGPLFPYIGIYLKLLQRRGYKRSTTYPDELLLVDLDRWLARDGLRVRDFNEAVAARFLRCHMRSRRTRRAAKWATLRRLLAMLRDMDEIPTPRPPKRTEVEKLVADFGHYLSTERGFVETTVAAYVRIARLFMARCLGSEAIGRAKIDAPLVINFARQSARKHTPITSQSTLVGLRSFLRYLWHRRIVKTDLSSSVPRIAIWSLAGLPKHLAAGNVEKVIARAASATDAIGIRNHAIVRVLARLGLRACEVADLRLEDFEWERGLVHVRSRKGARWATMPLPTDVGKAVATYLTQARPQCCSRHVFIRSGAPLLGMTRMGIGHVARTAMIRAGITGVRLGSHTFRHTLATELLRRGATLTDIGEVLRHRDASTTAIYAKVDLQALRSLAVAWPGGAS